MTLAIKRPCILTVPLVNRTFAEASSPVVVGGVIPAVWYFCCQYAFDWSTPLLKLASTVGSIGSSPTYSTLRIAERYLRKSLAAMRSWSGRQPELLPPVMSGAGPQVQSKFGMRSTTMRPSGLETRNTWTGADSQAPPWESVPSKCHLAG